MPEPSSSEFDALQSRWDDHRHKIDRQLSHYLESLSTDCPSRLRDAMIYSLLAPGKRLRPVLVLMSAEAVGGKADVALPAACAVEMIHCYSLIHDDLPAMDDDDLRRGRPTCHKQFDEATAILAGDALQALALELCATRLPIESAAAACGLLAKAAGPEALVGGQMDDLWAEKNGGDAALLQAIHRRKTGAMITVSVQLGALIGNGSTNCQAAMRQYGEKIGLAFQIVDDILDVESNSEAMGKRTGKDENKGKLTYPAVFGLEASKIRARELIDEAISSITFLGHPSQPLIDLARFVLDRSH